MPKKTSCTLSDYEIQLRKIEVKLKLKHNFLIFAVVSHISKNICLVQRFAFQIKFNLTKAKILLTSVI